jgi:hypothetical protein
MPEIICHLASVLNGKFFFGFEIADINKLDLFSFQEINDNYA